MVQILWSYLDPLSKYLGNLANPAAKSIHITTYWDGSPACMYMYLCTCVLAPLIFTSICVYAHRISGSPWSKYFQLIWILCLNTWEKPHEHRIEIGLELHVHASVQCQKKNVHVHVHVYRLRTSLGLETEAETIATASNLPWSSGVFLVMCSCVV